MSDSRSDRQCVGHVRWFSPRKGYGFLVEDGQVQDVFLHHSAIQLRQHRSLREGQRVVFTIQHTQRGPVAHDVLPIAPS